MLYQLVKDSGPNLLTSKIKRVEIEKWGKLDDLETVFRDAMENTMRLYPAVVCAPKAEDEINFLETDIASAEEISMSNGCILLSSSRAINGALAIFYPGVREKLQQYTIAALACIGKRCAIRCDLRQIPHNRRIAAKAP